MQGKVENFLSTMQTIDKILKQRFPDLPKAKHVELISECFTATGCTPTEAAAIVNPKVMVHDLNGNKWEFSEEDCSTRHGYLCAGAYSSQHDGRTWAIIECLVDNSDPDNPYSFWQATAGDGDDDSATDQEIFDTFNEAAAWAIDLYDFEEDVSADDSEADQ